MVAGPTGPRLGYAMSQIQSSRKSRRAAAGAVAARWHRARVTAEHRDGRGVTESRHGTTAEAIQHGVTLALRTRNRSSVYRCVTVHGRVSTRLIGTELTLRRLSRRDLKARLANLEVAVAERDAGAWRPSPWRPGPLPAGRASLHGTIQAPLRSDEERARWIADWIAATPPAPRDVTAWWARG